MRTGRVLLFAVIMSLMLVLAGCGARVEQTIQMNGDGTGQIVVTGTASLDDVGQVKGGLEAVKDALNASVPRGWTLDVSSSDGKAVFVAKASFTSATELQDRMAAATGNENAVTWRRQTTPFVSHEDLAISGVDGVWARWATDALEKLTTNPLIEGVSSYVQWPGQERRPLWGSSSYDETRKVNSVSVNLSWDPQKGFSRSVDLIPEKERPLLADPIDWLRQTAPNAAITGPDTSGAFHIQFQDLTNPWGTTVQVSRTHKNLFWDRVTIDAFRPQVSTWLGKQVPVGGVSMTFRGPGVWSSVDMGTPAWNQLPWGHSVLNLSTSEFSPTATLIGYYPRPALYIAWGLAALVAVALAVTLPFAVRRYLPYLKAAIVGGVSMSGNVYPMYCPACGQLLRGQSRCECGQEVRPVPSGASAQLVLGWVKQAIARLVAVFRLEPQSVPSLWHSAVLGMLARALLMAALLNRLVNGMIASVIGQVTRGIPFVGLFASAASKPELHAFGTIFAALVVASACAVGVSYLVAGRDWIAHAIGALSDSQWAVTGSSVAALVLANVSMLLGLAVAAGGITWGQAVLAAGLGKTELSYRKRMILQGAVGAVSVVATLLVVGGRIKSAIE